MVEAGAKEVSEQVIIDAIFFGHDAIKTIVAAQKELQQRAGFSAKPEWKGAEAYPAEVFQQVRREWEAPMMAAMTLQNKIASYAEIKAVKKAIGSMVPEEEAERKAHVTKAADDLVKVLTRETILGKGQRLDGRRFDQIRPITCEVGLLPRTHGSALFTRGETQALVTATLGTSDDAQIIEEYEGESEHTFLLHYNFPPFSVGEAKFMRGPSRRDIGHGNLARRSLSPMLPNDEKFPYTVRVVSDILESNGSSSMATVCGGTLALMDAGVPIKAPVAGVAMGLVSDGDRFAVLTDIAGQEDHYGDMDFKVAGSAEGITGAADGHQDQGLRREILEQALEQARVGRLHVLDRCPAALRRRGPNISRYAPRIFTMQIPEDRIRDVIGSGGRRSARSSRDGLQDRRRGLRQGVHRVGRRGRGDEGDRDHRGPHAGAGDRQGLPRARSARRGVRRLRRDPAGQDGLVHISELAPYRVRQTTDVVKEGDEVTVKIIAVDPMGKIKLSRKQALSKEETRAGDGAGSRRRAGEDEGRGRVSRAGDGVPVSSADTSTATTAARGVRGGDRSPTTQTIRRRGVTAAPFFLFRFRS
jgi:polyribonucleotide nucleotidyltransferase